MFDEIFKRWITTGQLYDSDIIPILLAWDEEFHANKMSPEKVAVLAEFLHQNPFLPLEQVIYKALKYVGIKKGYVWSELRDQNGNLMCRFFNE